MLAFAGGNQLLDAKKILDYAGVHQGLTVADLGCGTAAHFVFPAAKMVGDGGKVYAVDIQKPILESVKDRMREMHLENIETVWTDLEVYGAAKAIKDGALDVALLLNTLYQSKNKPAMMKESVRMLRPGGQLTIVEWKQGDAPMGPKPEIRIPEAEARKLAVDAHLSFIGTFDAGSYHYGLVYRK